MADQKATATVAPFKKRLAAFKRTLAVSLPLQLAAALAFLFVLLTALVLWRQSRPAPEVVQTLTPSEKSETPQSSLLETTSKPAGSDDPSTHIVLALEDDGGRVTLDAQGAIKGLEALSPEAHRAVKNALTTGRVERSDSLTGLSGNADTLMGGSQETNAKFSLLRPVGIVVRASRPRLRWRPLPQASMYTVTVLDSDLRIVAISPALSTTTWTLPRALERGRIYRWQVSALKDGQVIITPAATEPEARFRVLNKRSEDELRRLESINARSHLARGVLYAEAGLLDQAEREFTALVAANPKSTVASNLLQSVNRK